MVIFRVTEVLKSGLLKSMKLVDLCSSILYLLPNCSSGKFSCFPDILAGLVSKAMPSFCATTLGLKL